MDHDTVTVLSHSGQSKLMITVMFFHTQGVFGWVTVSAITFSGP